MFKIKCIVVEHNLTYTYDYRNSVFDTVEDARRELNRHIGVIQAKIRPIEDVENAYIEVSSAGAIRLYSIVPVDKFAVQSINVKL